MKHCPARPRSTSGFTLVELLTVITIIAILMALLFPAIVMILDSIRKKRALQDTLSIVHAIERFNGEYGQFPKVKPDAAPPAGAFPDDRVGDPIAGMQIDNASLFNVLRDLDQAPNADHAQNPRHLIFLETRNAVTSGGKPRDGFADRAGGPGSPGSFYDPWGTQYNIVMDSNSDNTIDVKDFYTDFAGLSSPKTSFGAFSLGKDRMLGTKGDRQFRKGETASDDLLSWESR